jgi:hypothetical protein
MTEMLPKLKCKIFSVFGSGSNLSHESCGFWNPGDNPNAPWRVVIRGPGNSTSCFATLISPTTVFACECQEIFLEIAHLNVYLFTSIGACSASSYEFTQSKNKAEWSAYLGKCHDPKESLESCTDAGAGQKVQVRYI